MKANAPKTGAAFVVGGHLFAGPVNSLCLFYARYIMVALLARHQNDFDPPNYFYFYFLFIAAGHRVAAWKRIAEDLEYLGDLCAFLWRNWLGAL
ncbi:hypothetical protein STFR1_20229 [Bacillus vallismortis]